MRIWLKNKILLSEFRSQRRFCMDLGKSDNWLSEIIVGRKDPSEAEKKLIADTLGVENSEQLFFNAD